MSPSIGPHEGIELELMLDNKKKIALFYSDYEIPAEFNPYINNKKFLLKKMTTETRLKGVNIDFYIIYQSECEKDVDELIVFLKESILSNEFNTNAERNIGRLLGYSEHDIEFYINKICNNNKK